MGLRDGPAMRTRVQLPAPTVQKLWQHIKFDLAICFFHLYVLSDPVLTLNITGVATWFHFNLKASFNIICHWLTPPIIWPRLFSTCWNETCLLRLRLRPAWESPYWLLPVHVGIQEQCYHPRLYWTFILTLEKSTGPFIVFLLEKEIKKLLNTHFFPLPVPSLLSTTPCLDIKMQSQIWVCYW